MGVKHNFIKISPSFLLRFTVLQVIYLKAQLSQLDGSRGLKRAVSVQGNTASYGNFAVDKFHRLQEGLNGVNR